MNQSQKWILRMALFKKFSVLYFLLLGLLLINPNQFYCQSDIFIFDNITDAQPTPGPEPYYIGDGKSVGILLGTGSSDLNLTSLVLGFWQSQGNPSSYYTNFVLEIYDVYDVGGNIAISQLPIYIKQFSNSYVSTTSGDLSTLGLDFPYFRMLANSKYLISIRKTGADSLPVYWVTHQLFDAPSTVHPGWNVSPNTDVYIKYQNSNQWFPIGASLEGELYLRLVGSSPNASVSTTSINQITYSTSITAFSGGSSVTESGSNITTKGICWSTSQNPTISNDFTNEGAGTADFTSTLTNLLPNTTYYVRAYVTDATGTYYGSETSFSTNRAPVITSGSGLSSTSVAISENTTAVTTIQATDADVPAQNLTYSILGGADVSKFTINSATGVVAFVTAPDYESPTDSDTNNTYIVEVQVTDNGSIAKSATQTITVTVSNVAEIPTITDANSLTVGITGGTLTGTVVTNGGGGAISERGFIYAPTSVNANPIIGGAGTTKIVVSGTTGNFTKAITGLNANTAYTFKAFATNTTGTAYSEIISLTTNGLTAGPSISYESQILQQNVTVASITPVNVGSTIPAGSFSKVTTFAGSSEGNVNSNDPLTARFDAPMGMVMDANRNIYVADSYNHRIRRIDGTTGVVSQIAGQSTPTPFLGSASGSNDGTGIGNARFDQPSGMTYDGQDAIYIADRGNNKIRKLVLSTGAVTTIAGGGSGSSSGYTDATGTAARFLRPTDVVFRVENGVSFLYVADAGNHCIRKINLSTNVVTTFAGSNTSGTTEGVLTSARFNNPTSLAFSNTGVLYVVDRGNQKIRKIESGTVATFAGSGTNATTNGTAGAASFADPYGIAIDGGDNLYITQALDGSYPSSNPGFSLSSSSTNNYIRKITPNGVVTNFIGTGVRNNTNNDNGLLATLSSPAHLLFDINQQYLYVSEWFGDDIRRVEITGYTITPVLPSGLSFQSLSGAINGTPTTLTPTTTYTATGYNYYGASATNFNITVANLPTVSTTAVTSVTPSTAVSGGNITNNGGISLIEKGICWSTNVNPTINDNKLADETTATGTFISNLTGLNPLITYYVRAYATNELGTSYGDQISFTTTVLPPIISYNSNNVFTLNRPIVPLQVTNTGGPVNTTTGVITIAGTGVQGVNDGLAFQSTFSSIGDLFCDKFGEIYIADNFASFGNRKLRKLDLSGNVSSLSTYNYSVSGVVVDELGNYYTSENYLSRIYRNGSNFTSTSINGVFLSSSPGSLTIDLQKNVYFSDPTEQRIGKVSPSGVVSTFVGGAGLSGYVDGHISTAKMNYPTNLTSDGNNIYFVDANNGRIRKIDINANNVSTIAGSGQGGYLDGPIATARIGLIRGLAVDKNGDIYFLDSGSTFPRIRKISNGKISTIVANGSNQYLDGTLNDARFTSLTNAMTIDANGDLYVADSYRIRKIMPNKFKVSPDLPAGLVLNSDGSISGMPTVLTPAINYTITALNSTGTSSYTISIAVENGITTVDAPTASAQTFCPGARVSDLVATGQDIKWYDVAQGGTALASNATVVAGTYYASQTLSGNESARTAVVVSITSNLSRLSSISGPTSLSSGATTATYSVPAVTGATSYVWDLPSGMTRISQTGPSVTVSFASNFTVGDIRVKAINTCSESNQRTLRVTKAPSIPVGGFSLAITGDPILCPLATQTYTATVVEGATYVWTVPSTSSIVSGQGTNSITVAATDAFTGGRIGVTATTSTSSQQATLNVAAASMPSGITGPTTVCGLTTATYSVTAQDGVSFQWTVPSGMSITSGGTTNSITVSIAPGVSSGSISVRSVSACGLSLPRLLDLSNTPLVARIFGETRVCGAAQATIGSDGALLGNTPTNRYTYTIAAIPGATSYTWVAPTNASIVSGQGTTSVVVEYNLTNFQSGAVSVYASNSCGQGTARTLTVSTVTGSITGPTNLCSMTTATYSVPSDLGTNFTWSVPQGMNIETGQGTTTITVSVSHPINFSNNNQVSVAFTTGCGGSKTLSTTVGCTDYTNLVATQCGTTISFDQRVFPIGVSNATGYRFNIYDATGNFIRFIENTYNFFTFTQLNFTLGATYQVGVQVRRGSGDSGLGIEGARCTVTLSSPTTSLVATQCGQSINYQDRVFPVGVNGATGYKFYIYNAQGTGEPLAVIENPYNFFRFTQMDFSFGASYQVKVQVKRGDVYGDLGPSCLVSLSGFPTTSLVATQCGQTINYDDRVFPIGVEGATGYKFIVYDQQGTALAVIENPHNFFRFTQMSFAYGVTYKVSVQVKRGALYGPEGSPCDVTIRDIRTRVASSDVKQQEQEVTEVPTMLLSAYPNPFTHTFAIRGLEGATDTLFYQVYDVTGKMIESRSVEANEVSNHTIGDYYPVGMYLVIARQGATTQTFKMVKQ